MLVYCKYQIQSLLCKASTFTLYISKYRAIYEHLFEFQSDHLPQVFYIVAFFVQFYRFQKGSIHMYMFSFCQARVRSPKVPKSRPKGLRLTLWSPWAWHWTPGLVLSVAIIIIHWVIGTIKSFCVTLHL